MGQLYPGHSELSLEHSRKSVSVTVVIVVTVTVCSSVALCLSSFYFKKQ